VVFFFVPALAALLVSAHAIHGVALDIGARRAGAKGTPLRALRFGLYAAGWDLVFGPIGFVVVGIKEGAGAALGLGAQAMGLPGRAARAIARGAYQLHGAGEDRAVRTSYFAAAFATIVAAILLLGGLVALVFA
jgi:hypothetical protein